jgi:hypothetical protein
MARRVPFCDVVLMLIRDKPGRTRSEIAEEAASWRLVWSLMPEKPSAALSLLRERGNLAKGLVQEAEESVNAAYANGYADEGSDGAFRVTAAGQEWLRVNSGL